MLFYNERVLEYRTVVNFALERLTLEFVVWNHIDQNNIYV